MTIRALTIFLLTLVLPVGLVSSVSASLPSCGCQTVIQCGCCGSGDSCPCVSDCEPASPLEPMAPHAGNSIKHPLATASDTRLRLESERIRESSNDLGDSLVDLASGAFAGVRLSAALCSFVI